MFLSFRGGRICIPAHAIRAIFRRRTANVASEEATVSEDIVAFLCAGNLWLTGRDGNVSVSVVSTEGGSPRRLTFRPGEDFARGWTPDSRRDRRAIPATSVRKIAKQPRHAMLAALRFFSS